MKIIRCAVIALSFCTLSVAAQERFQSATAGFSLSKPANWAFASPEKLGRTQADVSDEELQKAIEARATLPLVAITRERGPFGNFQVTLIPRKESLAKASARQILELLVVPNLKERFPDLALEPIREIDLAGHAAAEYTATYTVHAKSTGESMPVRVRAILVPRGTVFFLIDMIAPAEGYEQSRDEFAKILSSITIEK